MQDGLVLRDIHASAAPPWWPPAPGWWFVFAAIVVACALAIAWGVYRHRRRLRIERLFDDTVAAAGTPVRQVAAISELLRRAARRRDAGADRLQGEDWLQFLDADAKTPLFDGATGQLLRDGGFRRDVDSSAVTTLRIAARTRFIEWVSGRALPMPSRHRLRPRTPGHGWPGRTVRSPEDNAKDGRGELARSRSRSFLSRWLRR